MEKILDAGAMINSNSLELKDKSYTTSSVMKELKGITSKSLAEDAEIRGKLEIVDPKKKYVEKAKSKAKQIGSLDHLSQTDIDIVALAMEKQCKVVTDDYTIQNLLAHLKIGFEGVLRGEIKEKRWFKSN